MGRSQLRHRGIPFDGKPRRSCEERSHCDPERAEGDTTEAGSFGVEDHDHRPVPEVHAVGHPTNADEHAVGQHLLDYPI